MKLKDARTIGHEALFDRRRQAVALFKQGMKRKDIAVILDVHRNTVGEWIRDWKKGGIKALEAKPAGRPEGSGRNLTPAEEKMIRVCLIDNAPEQLKMPFALWSREAVQDLIRDKIGLRMPIRTVGEYLKRWGFTPQKPVRRSYERCPKKVRLWLDEEYPEIAGKARKDGAEIHWGDETGLRSDDVKGRGYAPKGKTPVRLAKGTPERINMISTVTNLGKLRFMFYRGGFNAAVMIDFMKRLIRDANRKVYLILDNLRVHHSAKVKEWVEKRKDQIELFYLPSYSPDLNPDEYLNNDLKSGVSKRPDTRRKGQLELTARSHMRSIQRQPGKIRNFFKAPSIQYAA